MSYDLIEVFAVISWGIITTTAVLIITIIIDQIDRWTGKRFRLLLVLIFVPACILVAYFVGIRIANFVTTNVYVAKDSVSLVVSEGDVAEFSTPGWHKLGSTADDIFDWPNVGIVTIEVFEKPGLIGGDKILIAKLDLSEMKRSQIFSELTCRNTSCLLNLIASKVRSVYSHQGCEDIGNSFVDLEKFGVKVRNIAYCR